MEAKTIFVISSETVAMVVRTICRQEGISIQTISQDNLGHREETREPSQKLLDDIPVVFEARTIDAVVIGNDDGAGIKKAGEIEDGFKKRTIILWGTSAHYNEKEYAELGFTHFAHHETLGAKLHEILGV